MQWIKRGLHLFLQIWGKTLGQKLGGGVAVVVTGSAARGEAPISMTLSFLIVSLRTYRIEDAMEGITLVQWGNHRAYVLRM